MAKYTTAHHYKALQLYEDMGGNIAAVARNNDMPSRPILYRWKEDGLPTELTGGKDWDEYLEEKQKNELIKTRERELTISQQEDLSFVDATKERLREMIEFGYERFMNGAVEIKGGDITKWIQWYIKLDNQAADKIEFMNLFAAQVFEEVAQIMDEQQFALFQSRMYQLQNKKRESLGDIPEKALLIENNKS